MIAVTGITGRIGGRLAAHPIAKGIAVRAVVRDPKKAENRKRQGCGVAVAQQLDEKALEGGIEGSRKGETSVQAVIRKLIDSAAS